MAQFAKFHHQQNFGNNQIMKVELTNTELYVKLNENANIILLTLSIFMLIVFFIGAAIIII